MKHTLLTTTVAIMIAAAASPSYAANLSVGADGKADTKADTTVNVGDTTAKLGASADADASAATGNSATSTTTNVDSGSLVAAISSDAATAATVQEMSDISSVTVVKVKDVIKANDEQTVKAALAKSKLEIAKLQAAVAANSKLKAKLEEKSINISSVVALNVAANSAVTVFVN